MIVIFWGHCDRRVRCCDHGLTVRHRMITRRRRNRLVKRQKRCFRFLTGTPGGRGPRVECEENSDAQPASQSTTKRFAYLLGVRWYVEHIDRGWGWSLVLRARARCSGGGSILSRASIGPCHVVINGRHRKRRTHALAPSRQQQREPDSRGRNSEYQCCNQRGRTEYISSPKSLMSRFKEAPKS